MSDAVVIGSGPIPWQAEEVRQAGRSTWAATRRASVLGAIEEARSRVPERPFLLLGQESVADPSRAPQGRHPAWAYTHAPAAAAAALGSPATVEAIEAGTPPRGRR